MAALLSFATTQAQTILEEDFETGVTVSQATPLTRGEGWTTVNSYSGDDYRFNWHNEYRKPTEEGGSWLSGANCASCDGSGSIDLYPGANGPREEILLSPELDLNDTYQLQFMWCVSPMASEDRSRYDLQVRVVTDNNLAGAETVFSIQDERMLRESGVTVFPISTWERHISRVDLSDFKGEKVKLAFVYKMFTQDGNSAYIDDITVKKFTPPTGPVPQVSLDRIVFGDVYVGERFYSDVIRLVNVGKDGLKITGFDMPEGITTTLDMDAINLQTYQETTFQLAYSASFTSKAEGNAIIHTTGGDITIAFSATKQVVPEGYQLETFNDYFPPAGWKSTGWSASTAALEGDQSVYCGGDLSACYLTSPRLDLMDGGKVIFTYYNLFNSDDGYGPYNEMKVQLSDDGGETWKDLNWTCAWDADYNKVVTAEVVIPAASDNSKLRWVYPAVGYDQDEGAEEHSSFTLDRVLLPNVYGIGGKPMTAQPLSPANNATEVYPKDIVLKWAPAQFATGYKVYVGTSSAMNELVDGANVGSNLSITIPQAGYETIYRWKVVPYNDMGENTESTTWRFTTQKDASVMEFPYEENFDKCDKTTPVPTGWLSVSTSSYTFPLWGPNSLYPYGSDGNSSAAVGASLAAGHLNAGETATLYSPEFVLPSGGKGMNISFDWGNAHPSDLLVDKSGLLTKQNVEGGNGKDVVIFEIYADGEWHQASYLSENADASGKKYWRHEVIDLTPYAGKRVQFRWVDRALVTYYGYGTLDNVKVDANVDDYALFNVAEWNSLKVNYGKAEKSEELSMLNRGKNALKVKSVTFTTENFESNIPVGTEIAVGDGIKFNVQFNAKTFVGVVKDVMTVEFESGAKATLPVSGEALAQDVLFYGFEKNPLDYDWQTDFTTIDVDGQTNYKSNYYLTVIENDGGRYAFTQAIHSNPNLTAHTGVGTLCATAPDNNSAADDWLISKAIRPQEGATFDFYARNLGTTGSVFIGDNDLHTVTVYVNDNGNKNKNEFKVVMNSTEMAYLGENKWHHFTVDLSSYAGKDIFVAVQHTTGSANWMAFFDDFTFTHVYDADPSVGIDVPKAVNADTEVTVYTANGVLVAKGRAAQALQNLNKGMYVVKAANGQTVKAVRK